MYIRSSKSLNTETSVTINSEFYAYSYKAKTIIIAILIPEN